MFAQAMSRNSPTAPKSARMIPRVELWVDLINALLTCFTVPFSQTVLTLLYFDQRVRKEGYGIEMQAAALAAESGRAPSAG